VPDPAVLLDLAYRELVLRTAGPLAVAGIPLMPLKGVLFAYWLYENPGERLGGDVDLLVPADHFDRAIGALLDKGFTLDEGWTNPHERTLLAPGLGVEIDLHRGLFQPGRYRIRTADLFERGRSDRSLFGIPITLPDPLDAFAHVVGHEAGDRAPGLAPRKRRDLDRLTARFALHPRRVAAHLEAMGLARAARYVLGAESGVVRALRPDPFGERLVALVRAAGRRFPGHTLPSRLAGHLLNASLPRAAAALPFALLNRARMSLGLDPLWRP
jgi:hypothetical protein